MSEEPPYKPRRIAHAQVRCDHTARGDTYYILHNPDCHTYLEIDPENYFLWDLMDGDHTVAEIAMAYYRTYGTLPLERLDAFIAQLTAGVLLEGAKPATSPRAPGIGPRLQNLADTAFQREFDWNGADAFFTAFYRRIGWILFTRAALLAFALISITGFLCFIILEPTTEFQLLTFDESYGHGLIVLFIASWVVLFWHESAHALACKLYSRHIHKAGVMFYYGMPAFFVDASDMWMAERKPRMVVSLAGPVANLIIGGAIAILIFVLPPADETEVLFQVVYVTYLIALLNLNPLLELDGYYFLMDWLEMPRLRERSFAFLRSGLPAKLRERSRFTREEIIYTLYSILSIVVTALIVLIVLYIWNNEVRWLFYSAYMGQDLLAVVLLGGLTIVAGSFFVLGLVARLMIYASGVYNRMSGYQEGDKK